MAGESTTVTTTWSPGQYYKRFKVSFVADDTDAGITDATLQPIYGYVTRIVVVPSPGTPVGPTNGAWDLVIVDENGADITAASATFADMSATATVSWIPDNPVFVFESLTLSVTDNAVNSAEVDVYVYIQK